MIFVVKFSKIESLCRPNILINSDFKSGIINQKNSTSYTGLGTTLSTIDMWISYGINVGLNATSVRFINRDTSYHTIRQKYDVNLLNDQKYTVYMKVINLVGTVYINPKTDKTKLQRVVNGENTYTFTVGEPSGANVQNNEFIIGLEAGAEVEIQCLKLEKGSSYTGMPAWNYTLELLKCQKYLLVVKPLFSNSTYFKSQSGPRTSRVVIQVPTPVQMNKKPVIVGTVVAKHRCYTDKEYWVTVTNPEVDSMSSTHLNIVFSQDGLSRNIVGELWIESSLILDAYDY